MNDFLYDDDERDEQREAGIHGDEEDYGRCPVCGKDGEMIAQGRRHWMVCHNDQTKWRIGTGFFSIFQRDRPAQWDRPKELLAAYREVEPLREEENDDKTQKIERLKRMFD